MVIAVFSDVVADSGVGDGQRKERDPADHEHDVHMGHSCLKADYLVCPEAALLMRRSGGLTALPDDPRYPGIGIYMHLNCIKLREHRPMKDIKIL